MARNQNSSSSNTLRSQRINQAKYGDITVRYGKDKRSNINKKVPPVLKTQFKVDKKKDKALSSPTSSNRRRRRLSHDDINKNRITLAKFVKWSLFTVVLCATIWASTSYDVNTRQKRSVNKITEVLNDFADKYIYSGYAGGKASGAAWSRFRRSAGAYGDDMSNPHNGAEEVEDENRNIIQKVFSDFSKLLKSESKGYTSHKGFNKNFENSKEEESFIDTIIY